MNLDMDKWLDESHLRDAQESTGMVGTHGTEQLEEKPGTFLLESSKKVMIEFNYSWTIDNFNTLMNVNAGQGIRSDTFLFDQTKWHFILHPNGSNAASKNFVSMWLFNDSVTEEIFVEYQMTIGEQVYRKVDTYIKPGHGNGTLRLVSHGDILRNNFLDDKGRLVVNVTLYKQAGDNVSKIHPQRILRTTREKTVIYGGFHEYKTKS